MSTERPSYCCHPDCFNCPYPDCEWDGNAIQYRYNHSEKGKEALKRYAKSDKGRENERRKSKRKIDSGKNAEYCRTYYHRHRQDILAKKRSVAS